MGMYTELVCGFKLKKNTDDNIKKILLNIVNGEDNSIELPVHDFFCCNRWRHIGQFSSFYFPFTDSYSTAYKSEYGMLVSIRASIKNYDSEIRKFIDWVEPYIDESKGELLGYYRYEENKEPTLWYFKEGKKCLTN